MNFAPSHTATSNACKLCTPLGACLAFHGIEGAVTLLHGSQGCATYIRRYVISHFREPMDVASSNFSEATAIFGGAENFRTSLVNIIRQYQPRLIGIATTCLAETIGERVEDYLRDFHAHCPVPEPPALVPVSTPSYRGTHADGYRAAVRAVVKALVEQPPPAVFMTQTRASAPPRPGLNRVNVLPAICSPADLRHLRELVTDFGMEPVLLPDYADTLDGPAWSDYQRIPPGGTPLEQVRTMGCAKATLELGFGLDPAHSAGKLLHERCAVPHYPLGLPIGVRQTDAFCAVLHEISGRPTPARHQAERGRLIDSFVDGHKYVFEKRAVVFGETDLVVGLAALLREIGILPVVCASGGGNGQLRPALEGALGPLPEETQVLETADFTDIAAAARQAKPHLLIGHSKGYRLARELRVPLVRVGFPIHDRIGAARILHVGYRGTQQLFDRLVNALLQAGQDESEVGYSYV